MSIETEPDFKKMTGISIIIAVSFTLAFYNLEKPIRKKYRETFGKHSKYRMKPIVRQRKKMGSIFE